MSKSFEYVWVITVPDAAPIPSMPVWAGTKRYEAQEVYDRYMDNPKRDYGYRVWRFAGRTGRYAEAALRDRQEFTAEFLREYQEAQAEVKPAPMQSPKGRIWS